jgi:nucleoside-diphosphate-sugar epimerase
MPVPPLFSTDLDLILRETQTLWEPMRGQQMFVTGGTGFFGCWLLESFCHINRELDLNASATVLTRNPSSFSAKVPHLAGDPCVHLLAGDVRDFEFPDGHFPFVIHAATEASARQAAEAPMEMLSTILAGTERTLEFAATHGTARWLLTSSGAVYGKQPSTITHVPEAYEGAPDPLDSRNVYGEGKRAAELMCSVYQKTAGIECAIARCWAFCGPHLPLNAHFAIGNFIGNVLRGEPILIQGDGTPRRSYLYGADLAIWLWTILFRAPSLTPINVGSEEDLNIVELAQKVSETLDPDAVIHVAGSSMPGVAASRYVPSVDRARQLLGLRKIVSLEESIRKTAEWYRMAAALG